MKKIKAVFTPGQAPDKMLFTSFTHLPPQRGGVFNPYISSSARKWKRLLSHFARSTSPIIRSLAIFFTVSLPTSFVFADTVLKNPIKFDTFSDFVSAVTKTAVQVLMPFVVLMFIYSGFLFVRAQGNEAKLKAAKETILWSVVGAIILFGAWGFAEMIGKTVQTFTK